MVHGRYPHLAARLQRVFATALPNSSDLPELTGAGRLMWRETLEDGTEVIHTRAPGSTLPQQIALRMIGGAPVAGLL